MSSLGLNTGLKALLAAQARLETIGHNVSNATTPGYSRQTLEVANSGSIFLHGVLTGTGVEAQVVRRTVDLLVQARLTTQTSTVSRLETRVSTLSQAENLFAAGSAGGLGQLFKKFFASLTSLSATPEDKSLAANAVSGASDIASKFNLLSSGAGDLAADAVQRVKNEVGVVNQLAERISRLNAQILATEPGGAPANDLRDQREQALQELARFTDVRAVEDERGAVRVLVGGQSLVSTVGFQRLEVVTNSPTDVSVRLKGSNVDAAIAGGSIGGLLGVLAEFLPGLRDNADQLAHEFILEMNRVHSTGMPAGGPQSSLVGSNALQDLDGDGQVTDELLAQAGLPFEVKDGELFVNVTHLASGTVSKHGIPIDAARTTVGDLVNALSAVPNLGASIDGQGRLQLQADSGFGFDFSTRLDTTPDAVGSFGGGPATLGTPAAGPFALAIGDTLDFSGPLGPFSVAFQPQQFQSIGQATAAEMAAVLNADGNFQANGLTASDVGGALVVQTSTGGPAQSFTLTGGTAVAALGWTAGSFAQGQNLQVSPVISGAYTGGANGVWTFRPSGDGTIGTTAGLQVDVFDERGARVARLDVGAGYQPGTELVVADGVKVAFGLGNLSATNHDQFRLDVLADSDTSDLLPALGLGGLFVGSDAATIDVRADILESPELLATSKSGAAGDAGNLLRMLQLGEDAVAGLGGQSFTAHYAEVSGGVSLELASAQDAAESESFLQQSLAAQRDQVSGVNVDEELARMIEAQQAYSAAGEYIRVINDLTAELMNIL
jgi:flagellar hook-associated protein 1 FlgK